MNPNPEPPSDPRMEIEDLILLHSTQELPPQQAALLDAHLADDPEAAAFSEFLHETLPAAAMAPRDFAAEAIGILETEAPRDFAAEAIASMTETQEQRRIVQFPGLPKFAWVTAGAAAAVVIAVTALWVSTRVDQVDPLVAIAVVEPPARLTVQISARLDALEADLMKSRSTAGHSRYKRSISL